MLKTSKKTLIFFLFWVYFLAIIPVRAIGPPESAAFIFCRAEKDLSEEFGYRYKDFIAGLEEKLGEPLLIHSFHMESGDWGTIDNMGGNRLAREERYQRILNTLFTDCKNDTSTLKNNLPLEIEKWVDELDDEYGQGSLFLIAPYSEENLQIIKNAIFPEIVSLRSFPYLKIEVKEGWIFAHTSDYKKITIWDFLLPGLVISLLLMMLASYTYFTYYRKNK